MWAARSVTYNRIHQPPSQHLVSNYPGQVETRWENWCERRPTSASSLMDGITKCNKSNTLYPSGHPGQGEENHSTPNPLLFTEPYPSFYIQSTLISSPDQDATHSQVTLRYHFTKSARLLQKPAKHSRQYPHRNNNNNINININNNNNNKKEKRCHVILAPWHSS